MTQEYGNYEKYERNRIKMEYKEHEEVWDQDKIYDRYLDLIKRLPTKEKEMMEAQKREEIDDLITTQETHHNEFSDQFFTWKENSSLDENFLEDKERDEFVHKNPEEF